MDIRGYIASLRRCSELLELNIEIDGRLELAIITDLMSKKAGQGLLFPRVKGSRLAVASNLFGSDSRMAQVLGHETLASFGLALTTALLNTGGKSSAHCLQQLVKTVETTQHPTSRTPQLLNLDLLPALRFWPKEERSFWTLAVVITRAPESGLQNYGLYRVGIASNRSMTLNLLPGSGGGEHLRQWRAKGKAMPVAVLLGADPALIFAAAASLPQNCSEELFSAYLSQSDFQSCRCKTVPLNCPSSGELLIEGWLDAEAVLNEGPFGCYTGDYGGSNLCPLVTISSIEMLADPVLPVTLAGPLPMEDCWIARANLELIRARLAIDIPEICSIEMPLETAFHGLYFLRTRNKKENIEALALRMRDFNYLARTKLLILLHENDDNLSDANWRDLINKIPSERIWRDSTADLGGLLNDLPPRLKHDSELRANLVHRLHNDAPEFTDLKGERCKLKR